MVQSQPVGQKPFILRFEDIRLADVARVGGKNASLGEMIGTLGEKGVRVPGGFATTAAAYWALLDGNGLPEKMRHAVDLFHNGKAALHEVGTEIRELLLNAQLPANLEDEIGQAYSSLCAEAGDNNLSVAVRSSATAEDLPQASFAGQQRLS